MRRPLLLICASASWAIVVGAGLWRIWAYSSKPGPAGTASENWPAESRLARSRDGHTLVMLVHPRCPCTRASVGELARVMTRCRGRLVAYVLANKPAGVETDWEKTGLWRTAAEIPGVTVVIDQDGREARRFGAATSGQVLLYEAEGRLVFRGGITAARGHSGDNAGEDAVVSRVLGGSAGPSSTFVFGCSLWGEGAQRN